MTQYNKIPRKVNLVELKKMVGLKVLAYDEYIAARILFNCNSLLQACILANTCIEKEMKACLFVLGIEVKKNHNTNDLLNQLQRKDPFIRKLVNIDFIKMLTKVYKARYFENLSPGHNFVIIRNKFLAELDYTFDLLERRTTMDIPQVMQREDKLNQYGLDKQKRLAPLYSNNYLLNRINKTDFLNQPDIVHELRIFPNHEVIQQIYSIYRNEEHDKFDYVGMTLVEPIVDNKVSFIASHRQNPPEQP